VTPSARTQAAIDLVAALFRSDAPPADQMMADWFRTRRFVGSKDRRAIAELVYAVLRHRSGLAWRLLELGVEENPRTLILAALVLIEGRRAEKVSERFDGSPYGATRLRNTEENLVAALVQAGWPPFDGPPAVRIGLPEWLVDAMPQGMEERAIRALSLEEAPVDLRVNTLKTDRAGVIAALAAEGIEAVPTMLSPVGLRLPERKPLSGTKAFRDGLFEVQDEGSQLAALLVDARPGQKLIDFCAGAGGKSLALAAAMQNKGRIMALDISEGRLDRAADRLRRAGAHIVQRKTLTSQRDPWVKRHKASWDRVLVDAPCTGTGTFRRNPDRKWKLKPEEVGELQALQKDILDSAARLVAPGGRLVYVTCSVLPAEDEDVVEPFLAEHGDFEAVPIADLWPELIGGAAPEGTGRPFLRLDPLAAGTDGFFVAVMQKRR